MWWICASSMQHKWNPRANTILPSFYSSLTRTEIELSEYIYSAPKHSPAHISLLLLIDQSRFGRTCVCTGCDYPSGRKKKRKSFSFTVEGVEWRRLYRLMYAMQLHNGRGAHWEEGGWRNPPPQHWDPPRRETDQYSALGVVLPFSISRCCL